MMRRVQRRMAMRIASTYSTISTEASQIIADVPPIDLIIGPIGLREERNLCKQK